MAAWNALGRDGGGVASARQGIRKVGTQSHSVRKGNHG